VNQGAVVLFCGENHHPAGMLLPIEGNQLLADRIWLQVESKKPLEKRLWQQIVQAKLRRQAERLPTDHPAHARIMHLSKNVTSDDSTNAEGQAARYYWPAVFGESFRRDRDGAPPNNLLNYGYMVLRAAMARAICGAGLHPAFGLHHHHRNNTFCLADDLLEPYRPFVDARVVELWRGNRDDIGKETKAHLLQVLTDEVIVAGRKGPLLVALSKTVSSLVDCLAGEREKLDLPQP
jgi:CRISPR-associated protein Cas1